jgi:predicted DNA-binding protein (MmcQ/YjbR family)
MPPSLKQLRSKVRDFALSLPETSEHLPWGERVVKVNKKVFVFMGRDMDPSLGLGVKLTASHAAALAAPGVARMGYGLGKSGWVSAKFEGSRHPTFERLRAWVLESYCAVAPKKLAAQVGDTLPAKPRKQAPAERAAQSAAARRKRPAVASRAIAKKPAPKRVR